MKAARTMCLLGLLCLYSVLSTTTGIQCRNSQENKVAYTFTVSKLGTANFTKVQDAFDAVPSANDQWVRIYVDSGTYWEQVEVTDDKQCILLEGHSREDTVIEYDAHEETDTSSTFICRPDNFVAKNIAFKNSYGLDKQALGEAWDVRQAVAISIYGDKSTFYNCSFIGYQDTIWDVTGRHLFKHSYIEGAIDFIWGYGQSVYKDCTINVTGDGYITAQGRSSLDDEGGFVFIRGSIIGSGNAYLGRAYRSYSRVIFDQTVLSDVVNPIGWDAWLQVGHESNFTYMELNCTGEGADMSKRVAWEKRFDASESSKYSIQLFIDHDEWISQQP